MSCGNGARGTSRPTRKISRRRERVIGPLLERLEPRWLFDTYQVTVASDSVLLPPVNSLRWAIQSANAHAGADTITFSLGVGGAQAITVAGALPAITEPLTIDGYSQGGSNYTGPPMIRLDNGGSTTAYGLYFLNVGGNTVKGLALTKWGYGLVFDNTSSGIGNNTINGNYVGLSTNGRTPFGSTYAGIYLLNSNNNTISNNVISANGTSTNSPGVFQDHSSGNVYIGNFIGTDAGGTNALGNGL